jgi:hypothetical protein
MMIDTPLMPRLQVSRHILHGLHARPVFNASNLGINYNRMNQHDENYLGDDPHHWLTIPYDVELVEGDLQLLTALGIRLLRIWTPIEVVVTVVRGEVGEPTAYADNLRDFLSRCANHDIEVIIVMGDGHQSYPPEPPYDGKMFWELLLSAEGIEQYAEAYVSFAERYEGICKIHSWEIANEPYGNLTWASYPQELGITKEHVLSYLTTVYRALKQVVDEPVGFSDIEEQEQAKYRTFSDPRNREFYVDECTDYYSMHIYRATSSQVANFEGLTNKPKFLSEVGHYNFDDPTGEAHAGVIASKEMLREVPNMQAVIDIGTVALNSGFSFIMPWDWSINPGMVEHHPDGSHTIKSLVRWMSSGITAGTSQRSIIR